MDKELKLLDLKNNGEYQFVYSDKYNIFFLFMDTKENKLYKITTDKFLNIEYIDEIETPNDFKDAKVKYFKPFIKDNEYSFIGIAIFKDDVVFKFRINENNILEYNEETRYCVNEGIVNNLNCLKTVDVQSYIQKKDHVYIIGYDEDYQDYIYAMVNINDDKYEKVYSLFTDYGDIIPLSINTDIEERKIYIVGKIINKEDGKVKPYFETFLL